MIDLGGGTFDVTLMEIFDGTLEIVATAGESALGGEDFTDRLVASVLKTLDEQLEIAELKKPLMVSRLRQQCEFAKRAFTDQEKATVRIPSDSGDLFEDGRQLPVSRAVFVELSQPLMDRLKAPVARVLRDGEITLEEIDDVIFVGGATRMSLMRDFVREFLKADPLCTVNPDEVVALGASIQAALIDDDEAVEDMVMTDVCPFTLGIATTRDFDGHFVEGYYSPVIHRNTTIPVSREKVFETLTANEREVELHVYQGESRKVIDNFLLGKLVIDDIPPGPARQPFYVRFTYDLNGILEVEAMAGESGRKHRVVITSHTAELTDSEVREAVERMQSLKFYPREDVGNQRLLLFRERVVGEVNPHEREQLDQALTVYEAAMLTSDRDGFEHALQGLLMTLSSLGFDYNEETGRADSGQ